MFIMYIIYYDQPYEYSKSLNNECHRQALKVLRTAEFMPFVVFIAAPELDTLRAMHKAVVDAGITTKLLTVSLISLGSPDIKECVHLYMCACDCLHA